MLTKSISGSSKSDSNYYTVRVYRSPLQTTGERVALFFLCLHHPVYEKVCTIYSPNTRLDPILRLVKNVYECVLRQGYMSQYITIGAIKLIILTPQTMHDSPLYRIL